MHPRILVRVHQVLLLLTLASLPYLVYENVFLGRSQTNMGQVAYVALLRTLKVKHGDLQVINPTLEPHFFTRLSFRRAGKELTMFVQDPLFLSPSLGHLSILDQFHDFLIVHPGTQLLDLGCGLGLYTLMAASLGSEVVAVDKDPEKTSRVAQSLLENGFQERTIVCLNEVSNKRTGGSKERGEDSIVGGGGGGAPMKDGRRTGPRTIVMDDLLNMLHKDQEVVIRLNVQETSPMMALEGASRLFSESKVIMVLMDWTHLRRSTGTSHLLNFFTKRLFKPFPNIQGSEPLQGPQYESWPDHVFWFK